MTTSARVEVEGRVVALTSLDRVMWPRVGYTKRQMLSYYHAVAPVLLPHLRDRPVVLRRFPEGVEGGHWYQMSCRGSPSWMRTVALPAVTHPGQHYDYCLIDDVAGLLWAVNTGAIELHALLFRRDRLFAPVEVVLDLDPMPPAGLKECCSVAISARRLIEDGGGRASVKTSGGNGLHIVVPLEATSFDETAAVARALADELTNAYPRLVTASKGSGRDGKVLVDWSQNGRLRSMVAPYSLRAAAAPYVATPLAWSEVESVRDGGDPEDLLFLPQDVLGRLDAVGDLMDPDVAARHEVEVSGVRGRRRTGSVATDPTSSS